MAKINIDGSVCKKISKFNDIIKQWIKCWQKLKTTFKNNFPNTNFEDLSKDFLQEFDFQTLINKLKQLDDEMKKESKEEIQTDVRRELEACKIIFEDFDLKRKELKQRYNVYVEQDLMNQLMKLELQKIVQNIYKQLENSIDAIKYYNFREKTIEKGFFKLFWDVTNSFCNCDGDLRNKISELEGKNGDEDFWLNFLFLYKKRISISMCSRIIRIYYDILSLVNVGYFLKTTIKDHKINTSKERKERLKIILNSPISSKEKMKKIKVPLDEKVIFGEKGPKPSDVRQGDVGDCYLLAALQYLASSKSWLLKKAIKIDRENKRLIVRLFQVKEEKNSYVAGKKVDVIIEELPDFGNTKRRTWWPNVFETSILHLFVGQLIPPAGDILARSKIFGNPKEILHGGHVEMIMVCITGKSTYKTPVRGSDNNVEKANKKNDALKQIIVSPIDSKRLIKISFKENFIVPRASWHPYDTKNKKTLFHLTRLKIVENHAYTYLGTVFLKNKTYCLLRNPWGLNHTQFGRLTFETKGKFIIESEFILKYYSSYVYKNKKEKVTIIEKNIEI